MSEDIREYEAPDWDDADDLRVTATYGGDEYGQAVQLTVGRSYARLSQDQVLDLIGVLARRVKLGDRTMTSTGRTDTKQVLPDGTVELQSEEVMD